MSKHTLTEVFGLGATQDATSITIQKADLPTLTAAANNSGSSLLVAILLKAQQAMTEAEFNADIDKTAYISNGFADTLVTRGANNTPYRNTQKILTLSKLDQTAAVDADDY